MVYGCGYGYSHNPGTVYGYSEHGYTVRLRFTAAVHGYTVRSRFTVTDYVTVHGYGLRLESAARVKLCIV